jgi:arylsulfatase A-like enzyme/Flp pilus assembly protein TadD
MPKPRRADIRVPVLVLFALLLPALACGPSDEPAPAPDGPDDAAAAPAIPESSVFDRVVLVSIDTLRADHVGAYGAESARTPTLDALAARGVRFEQAISPVPLTLPSHTTLMTGLRPPSHGVRHNGIFSLADDVPVLAEKLKEAGFATGAFVAAVVLDADYGLGRGFDVYDADVGFRRASRSEFSFPERKADRVVDAALAWLETAPEHFFLWVHLYDPHADYDPPLAFKMAMPDDLYGGEIAFADSQVGRLLGEIDERWPGDRTLVVVTSDHGDGLGEHEESTHSYGIYDSTQHIPLIFSGAGVPGGRVVPGVVRLLDVAPTILALAGAPPLEGAEGQSLEPLWRAPDAPESPGRVAYLETLATRLDMGWSPLLGVRTDRWKYIRAPRPELFDVRSDPGEVTNLYAERPEQAEELDRLLDGFLATTRESRRVELDEDQRRQLESLGYLVGGEAVDDADLAVVGGPDPKDHREDAELASQAGTLLAKGEPKEALDILLRIETKGKRTYHAIAKAGLLASDLDAAEYGARGLLDLGEEVGGRSVLGSVLFARGRVEEAEKEFRIAYELSTHEISPIQGLAWIADTAGDSEAAEKWLREAMERSPTAIEPRWRLAAIMIETGREAEGRAMLERLPREALDRPEARVRLGQAEMAVGHTDRAIEHVEAAVAALPDDVGVRKLLVGIYEAEGRTAEVIEQTEVLVRQQPDDPALRNNLAWYLAVQARDLDRALELARSAVADAGENPGMLDTLAAVHLAREEPAAALSAADRSIAAGGGDDPHVHYVRGAALAALGRTEEARAALARSRQGLGEDTPAWVAQARSLERELAAAADPSSG